MINFLSHRKQPESHYKELLFMERGSLLIGRSGILIAMWLQVQRDVDASSVRCGCRFREMLMQVRLDVDMGFRM